MKQAQALIAEQENDLKQALTLLREAASAEPGDIDIAFDRARIALEHAELAQPDDFDAYLKLEPVTPSHRVLRAYILTSRGQLAEARTEAQLAATAEPQNIETQNLLEALAPAPAAQQEPSARKVYGHVRVFSQYDTNVSVLPDRTSAGVVTDPNATADATGNRTAAAALGVEGDVRWTPVRGVTELSFLGGISFLGHLNDRSDELDAAGNVVKQGSKTYDFGTIDLQARLSFPRARWNSAVTLYGSSVFIDDFSKHYLTEGTLLGSTSYAVDERKAFRVGAYGLGGLREFGADFESRDGGRAEGGVTVDYSTRHVAVGARGGYQTELTSGDNLTERGVQGAAYVHGMLQRWDALASFVYQRRDYYKINRDDARFGPMVQIACALNDTFALFGTYQYIRNASTVTGSPLDYDYSRHLATLGLEVKL